MRGIIAAIAAPRRGTCLIEVKENRVLLRGHEFNVKPYFASTKD